MTIKAKNHTLYVCVTAMFGALLVGGKHALALVPNVEIVTLIVAVCAYVWGLAVSLPAVCVFVLCQIAIYGINTWVVYYPFHWIVLALIFWGLSKMRLKGFWQILLPTVAAVVWTALFGVVTSVVDTCIGFVSGQGFFANFDNFGERFSVMYLAGVSFYVTHIVCNLLLFATAFLPLAKLNQKAKLRLFGN